MRRNELREWFETIDFFERHDDWYFLSPHSLAVGPYSSEKKAQQRAAALAKILMRQNAREPHELVLEFMLHGG